MGFISEKNNSVGLEYLCLVRTIVVSVEGVIYCEVSFADSNSVGPIAIQGNATTHVPLASGSPPSTASPWEKPSIEVAVVDTDSFPFRRGLPVLVVPSWDPSAHLRLPWEAKTPARPIDIRISLVPIVFGSSQKHPARSKKGITPAPVASSLPVAVARSDTAASVANIQFCSSSSSHPSSPRTSRSRTLLQLR